MAGNFWRGVLLCQLAVAALTVRLLSTWTALAFEAVSAAALAAFWCVPGLLFVCTLALTHKSPRLGNRRSLADWGYFLQAVFSETIWFTTAALAMSFHSRAPKTQPLSLDAPPRPVLLIHGIVCNSAIWNPLVRRLQRAGIGPLLAINLEPPLRDIERHATTVIRALRDLRAQAPNALVSVVAHSMGGLVAREALRHVGPEVVKRLVTVGSPHHGTVLARFVHSRLTRQMRPESTWLAALNESQENRLPVPTVSIYSLEDWLIRPPRSASLKGADIHELRGIGHLGLLRDRVSINCIMSALTRE